MTDKVVRFPMNSSERVANRRGKRTVSCIVSSRWLRFDEHAQKMQSGTAILVDVLTDISGEERKLCQLCVTLEDLRRLLKLYE